jgi:hypothetical protein
MTKNGLVAAWLVTLISATAVMESTHEKYYRRVPPHAHSEMPATEVPSYELQAANSTITPRSTLYDSYLSMFKSPSEPKESK